MTTSSDDHKITLQMPFHALGYGCGAFFAAFLSYELNGSICWSILHFFLSWIYVGYKAAPLVAGLITGNATTP